MRVEMVKARTQFPTVLTWIRGLAVVIGDKSRLRSMTSGQNVKWPGYNS
jgi:hypothetical protein